MDSHDVLGSNWNSLLPNKQVREFQMYGCNLILQIETHIKDKQTHRWSIRAYGSIPSSATFPNSGGYSCRISPLPIPNRGVKTTNADGTAKCGRVGNCRMDERLKLHRLG